ncbi:MAG: hypothetical protein LKE33_06840 [Acidaminococcus sp.]|nr:hypothetical protein [Acidaminococcus sp.]MCI2100925.1 hypothetical protein [Acidaminococcus sp.]MCI2115276.1 hypothetical protein [Acidaminococcus sp.]MCI2117321.1 hypothetical protein [Acidaminococcus sp.]
MYHIAKDPRAQKSAQLIVDVVLALAKTTPANRISIASIQRISSVSRSTFYRLFDTPVDVLLYQADRLFDDFVARPSDKNHPRATLYSFLGLIMKHADLLAALEKCNRLDALAKNHQRYFREISSLWDVPESTSEAEKDYFVNFLSYLMPIAIMTWIERGQKDTQEEVYRYFWQSLKRIARISA